MSDAPEPLAARTGATRPDTGRLRRALLAVLLVGLAAGVAAFWLLRGPGVVPVPQDQPGPVLLVTGYGGSKAALAPLAGALTDAGREVVVVPPVGDGTGDLEEAAEALADLAGQIVADGAPSVDVVGYSAGGVVARLWVRDYGGGSLARRVLTVGSPHHGSDAVQRAVEAPGGCPTGCRQLAPDSDLLRDLNDGDETPVGPRFVSVYSTSDQVVTPPETAVLDGALNFSIQSVCTSDTAAHGDLPADPVVLATLGSALGVGPPQVPTLVCG